MNVEEILNKIGCTKSKPITKKITFRKKEKGEIENKIEVCGLGIYEENKCKKCGNRYYLEFNLKNNEIDSQKTMYVLLMNPSNTFPDKSIDSTIQNVIRVAYAIKEFKKVVILNSFSKICGNGEEAKKYFKRLENESNHKDVHVQFEKKNKDFVTTILNDVDEILIACGDGVSEEQYQSYLTQLKDKKIWTYANSLTLNSRPRHLSIRSSENRNQFYKFIKNTRKNYLTVKGNQDYFYVEYL